MPPCIPGQPLCLYVSLTRTHKHYIGIFDQMTPEFTAVLNERSVVLNFIYFISIACVIIHFVLGFLFHRKTIRFRWCIYLLIIYGMLCSYFFESWWLRLNDAAKVFEDHACLANHDGGGLLMVYINLMGIILVQFIAFGTGLMISTAAKRILKYIKKL